MEKNLFNYYIMPALTHGRVRNGFNGYATRVILPSGAVSNTQPLKYNGGLKPNRSFLAQYDAKVMGRNVIPLPSTVGVSTPIQRANARRAPNNLNKPCIGDCLPKQTFSLPVQAMKKRK